MTALPASRRFVLPSLLEEVPLCVGEIRGMLADTPFTPHEARIVTILREGIANAMIHGNRCRRDREVTVEVAVSPEAFRLTVEDEGPGFDHRLVPDPRHDENLSRDSGRGLLLIRELADEVQFNEVGNKLYVVVYP